MFYDHLNEKCQANIVTVDLFLIYRKGFFNEW